MNWIQQKQPDNEILHQVIQSTGLSRKMAILMLQKGFKSSNEVENFLTPRIEHLHEPYLLKGMEIAVNRLIEAREKSQKIMIYGDFDVDGISSVSMLYLALKDHFDELEYYIPDRKTEGYGLSKIGVDKAIDEKFSILLTVDCGISNYNLIQYAQENQVDVIVCDHHLPPEKIPPALAILNPKQADCKYPFKDLCGCGVAYKLLSALAPKLDIPIRKIYAYLDLVALATGCDMVPLVGENRVLCHYGLRCINKKIRIGLIPFFAKNTRIVMQDLYFKVGPKINTVGRVAHSHKAVELLTCGNINEAMIIFKEIVQLNEQRKKIGTKCLHHAKKLLMNEYHEITKENDWTPHNSISKLPGRNGLYKVIYSPLTNPLTKKLTSKAHLISIKKLPVSNSITTLPITNYCYGRLGVKPIASRNTVVIYHHSWTRGVSGLVATRLIEQWAYKPTIVLCASNDEIVGSGRSCDGINIHQALTKCKKHLTSFGGHQAAAGIVLKKSNINNFASEFEDTVTKLLNDQKLEKVKTYALDLEFSELNLDFYNQVQKLSPFGIGNEEPIFRTKGCRDNGLSKLVGKSQLNKHLQANLIDASKHRKKGIAFSMAKKYNLLNKGPVDVFYTLSLNTYWGPPPEVEMNIIDIQPHMSE